MKVIVFMDTREGVKRVENADVKGLGLTKQYLKIEGKHGSERVFILDKVLDYTAIPEDDEEIEVE